MIVSIPAELSTGDAVTLLSALGDETRLGIVRQLARDGVACVCEFETAPGVAPNLLSYHLKVLREAGLVATTRRGRRIEYSLAADAIDRLHAALPEATS